MPRSRKILIIGSPGSGKSTLARSLNEIWNLPLVHLDSKYHKNNLWNKDPAIKKSQWRDYIQELSSNSEWLMDGNYTSTLDIRIPKADLVIFLDYQRRISLLRALKRRIKYHNKKRPDMAEDWQEKINKDLFIKIWNFKTTHNPRIESLLSSKKENEVLVLKTPQETAKYLLAQK